MQETFETFLRMAYKHQC